MKMKTRSAWDNLSLYESTELLKVFHKERFKREINTGKAYEIASHISQGREYFESASVSSPLVKPLLIYYGVLALSRALILFSNEKNRESSLAQSHGLTALNWNKTLSSGIQNLDKIEIRAEGGGTLSQLIDVQNVHELWINNINPLFPYMPIKLTNVSWNKSFTLNLDDLLARTPELISTYLKVMGQKPKCRKARVALDVSDISDLSSAGNKAALATANMGAGFEDFEEIKKYFKIPEISSSRIDHTFFNQDIRAVSIITEFNIESIRDMNSLFLSCEDLNDIYENNMDGYLVFNLNSGAKLSKLTRMYCLSYTLGMLVRYNPTSWSSLINKRSGDKYLPLLKSATEMLESLFPEAILFHLQGHRNL
ncbi:hypothetical protein DESA109040_08615 [Deinococcus saxicola]|uniref:YaaC family protein n=1 Tax=Deinococcus saxicola TaxID=249406 RepID=UPI0039EF83DE